MSPHDRCGEIWNLLHYQQFALFRCEIVLSRFTRYCVEKIWAKNCARGEKMTNMRYAHHLVLQLLLKLFAEKSSHISQVEPYMSFWRNQENVKSGAIPFCPTTPPHHLVIQLLLKPYKLFAKNMPFQLVLPVLPELWPNNLGSILYKRWFGPLKRTFGSRHTTVGYIFLGEPSCCSIQVKWDLFEGFLHFLQL